MPFYHATRKHLLPSILRHGPGGIVMEQNFPGCLPGVYLAEDPLLAVSFLIEHTLEHIPEHILKNMSPKEAVESWIVIVIDDARVDRSRVIPDPQVDISGFWIYDGVIDVTNAVVVSAVDLPSP